MDEVTVHPVQNNVAAAANSEASFPSMVSSFGVLEYKIAFCAENKNGFVMTDRGRIRRLLFFTGEY
ncbi:MAG: hypothetical protein V8T87_13090 [Victivallales bacterium]